MSNNKRQNYKLVSLFSGAGGLDLGFEQAGYNIIWANDNDESLQDTYRHNFPNTKLDARSIIDINSVEIPMSDGIIGGPPCQSWSLAGKMKGAEDTRGRLFYEYVRMIRDNKPKFFLAENVPGIVSKTHINKFEDLIKEFNKVGYIVSYEKLNAADFGLAQERKRVFIVGIRADLDIVFQFPTPTHGETPLKPYVTQKEVIGDLPEPLRAKEKNLGNGRALEVPNHEYYTGKFSSRYMSRNRVRGWKELAYTVEASGRHAKLHPKAAPMTKLGEDSWIFDETDLKSYRRLSVRESARIQGFPDNFLFFYKYLNDGYKMIGNAVPVGLAKILAGAIKSQLEKPKRRLSDNEFLKSEQDFLQTQLF